MITNPEHRRVLSHRVAELRRHLVIATGYLNSIDRASHDPTRALNAAKLTQTNLLAAVTLIAEVESVCAEQPRHL